MGLWPFYEVEFCWKIKYLKDRRGFHAVVLFVCCIYEKELLTFSFQEGIENVKFAGTFSILK